MKSTKERQAEFKARQREQGLVQITVWIKEKDKPKILEYIEQLKGQ